MAVGEITRDGFPYLAVKGLSKTTTVVAKGAVVVFDTDGWITSGDAAVGPHGVALNTTTAVAQQTLAVLLRGCVIIAKANEAQTQGQAVKWNGTAAAILVEDKDNLQSIVGTVIATVAKAEVTTEIVLLQ